MGNVCHQLRGLSLAGRLAVLAGGIWLGAAVHDLRAQVYPVKNANDFSTVEYYDAPWQLQIKSRLSGVAAIPQSEHVVLIKQLRLEFFATNGLPEYIVQAPECLYNQVAGTASSPGPLKVSRVDGKVAVTGLGFCWQQDDESLTISNQDVTTIRNGPKLDLIP